MLVGDAANPLLADAHERLHHDSMPWQWRIRRCPPATSSSGHQLLEFVDDKAFRATDAIHTHARLEAIVLDQFLGKTISSGRRNGIRRAVFTVAIEISWPNFFEMVAASALSSPKTRAR